MLAGHVGLGAQQEVDGWTNSRQDRQDGQQGVPT